MADPQDDILMREIEEELRQEQAKKLWSRYGNYIIGLAVVTVAVVAGYQGWQSYDRSTKQTATERLIGAAQVADSGDVTTAIESFARVAADSPSGIALLAEFRRASLLAAEGDHAAAQLAYAAIAANSSVSVSFQDLAKVLGAGQLLDARPNDAQTVIDQLQPIIDGNNVWRHSAREVAAIAALEMGQKDQAIDYLQTIVLDPEAPEGLRGRAQELIQVIGE